MHDWSRGNLYEWPGVGLKSSHHHPSANVTTKASKASWHHRLGHPASPILSKIISIQSLPISNSQSSYSWCDSCLSSKSHRLPFGVSSLSCTFPLEIIYTDVWGPAPFVSFDNFQYYVIFVDYFTKYTWIYPLKLKSDVTNVF